MPTIDEYAHRPREERLTRIARTPSELAAAVRQEQLPTRVIILTTFARSGYLRRALDAGASGYLLKDSPAEQLANAIRRVHVGGRAIDPELAAEAWSEPDPLTERERQVLRMAGEGESSADIGAALNLSEGTVRNYLSEAISKIGAANRILGQLAAGYMPHLIPPVIRFVDADELG